MYNLLLKKNPVLNYLVFINKSFVRGSIDIEILDKPSALTFLEVSKFKYLKMINYWFDIFKKKIIIEI